MLSVLILDSHSDYRQWLVNLLRSQSDFEVLADAGTLRDCLEKVSCFTPELVLMDFNLPDGDSLQAARDILFIQPQAKIVFLTENSADENLLSAIHSGAKGYLLKKPGRSPNPGFVAWIDYRSGANLAQHGGSPVG